MKILFINCVYGAGSTGKITQDLHEYYLKSGIESVVYYGRCRCEPQKYVNRIGNEIYSKLNNLWSRITGIMYGGCFLSTTLLINRIKKENPDIVHLHCINGYFVNIYRLISWLKKNKIKTVLTLHAEFMYTANCGHAYDCEKWINGCKQCPRFRTETKSIFFNRTHKSFELMRKAFDGFDSELIVVSVSPWLEERAKRALILNSKKHRCVYNGINTNTFRAYDSCEYKSAFCSNGEKMIFHATAQFSDSPENMKGGIWILHLAERMKNKNVKFVVAGKNLVQGDLPENLILLGEVRDQEKLARLYSEADITLITSKKETFSMIVAESLCCGTPVVGFEAGAPETIGIEPYSQFVTYGNLDLLEEAIERFIECDFDKNIISSVAQQKYSKEKMAKDYLAIYDELI